MSASWSAAWWRAGRGIIFSAASRKTIASTAKWSSPTAKTRGPIHGERFGPREAAITADRDRRGVPDGRHDPGRAHFQGAFDGGRRDVRNRALPLGLAVRRAHLALWSPGVRGTRGAPCRYRRRVCVPRPRLGAWRGLRFCLVAHDRGANR